MTSYPEAMGWEFWWFLKISRGWDPKQGEASWDLKLDEASPVEATGCTARLLGQMEQLA